MTYKETRAYAEGDTVFIEIVGEQSPYKIPALTKKQRNEAYQFAFNRFRNEFCGPFICNVLRRVLIDTLGYKLPSSFCISATQITCAFFPEVSDQLPDTFKTADGKGWPMTDEWNNHRADVLAQCITLTNTQ